MLKSISVCTVVASSILSIGMAMPSFARPATLFALDANSRINVRSAPTTTAKTPHYGVVGDRIELLRTVIQPDQYAWNYVRFQRSGAEGWVRADFIRYTDNDTHRYAILGETTATGQRSDRINIRTTPSTQATAQHFGLTGDIVKVLSQTEAQDGYVWHQVEFPSGAKGWVRGDLVQMDEGGC
jgi:SH3-like domain-containing protein